MRETSKTSISKILRNCCPPLLCAVILAVANPQLPAQSRQPRNELSSEPQSLASLPEINSRAEFDLLARIYERSRFNVLPHVMFVIDRRDRNRVYFVNSRLYRFHKDFVNSTYLSLERGRAFFDNNHAKLDRRFLLGTIAYQGAVDKFAFEFWEGDHLSENLLAETINALEATFFAPLYFKPNSSGQELAANELIKKGSRILIINVDELTANQQYQPLNRGVSIGQLRIVDSITDDIIIDRNQIVIFKQTPVHLTPLSGVITTNPATPLSHINLLAKSWAIPNATIKNADLLFKSLEGKYVRYEVREDDYSLSPADPRDVDARNLEWTKRGDLVTPKADLAYRRLTDLRLQRARDAHRFGAKSANLGEIINSKLDGLHVPPGFSIPFHHYQAFLRRNNLEERIAAAVEEERFVHDARYRKNRLAEIRRWITEGDHDESFRRAIIEKTKREYAGAGLFVRSSTNAEDLPKFSGAGLYTTVPNVRGEDQLMRAIKAVWASLWNFEAYEARESFGMNHFGVFPAVLIQQGIDAESAGVAITTDPFNPGDRRAIFVNAKRGLGIKVVEGRRVAEQVIFHPVSNELKVLTRSDEDSMLVFDKNGGLKEVTIEKRRRVLTDEFIRKLARAALRIKRIFNGRDQDIEWVYSRGKLYIVQSRPFVVE